MTVFSSATKVETLARAIYPNGRWGDNVASAIAVTNGEETEYLFSNGYGDPYGYPSAAEAIAAFGAFISAKGN